jgi:hypothetical protein
MKTRLISQFDILGGFKIRGAQSIPFPPDLFISKNRLL